MTREEAVKYFKRHLDLYCVDGISREAEEMAIQALSQEPYEDAISREAAITIAGTHTLTVDETVKALERLPSVTQKSDEQLYKNGFADGYEQGHKDAEQKSGKWTKMFLTDTRDIYCQCSDCGFIHKFIDGHTAQYNYCPNCGAKMESEEQTE